MNFRGRRAWDVSLGASCIVTGAARGIGRAIGEALLDEGARSVLPISTAKGRAIADAATAANGHRRAGDMPRSM
jgi:meso-butanediol dehydrogenase/(S,S)-butanediol dehydrogenase/diacetyl reductase